MNQTGVELNQQAHDKVLFGRPSRCAKVFIAKRCPKHVMKAEEERGSSHKPQIRKARRLRRGEAWDAKAQAAERYRPQPPRNQRKQDSNVSKKDIPLDALTDVPDTSQLPGKSIFVRKMLENRAKASAKAQQDRASSRFQSSRRQDPPAASSSRPSSATPETPQHDKLASAERREASQLSREDQSQRLGRNRPFRSTGRPLKGLDSQRPPPSPGSGQSPGDKTPSQPGTVAETQKWRGIQSAAVPRNPAKSGKADPKTRIYKGINPQEISLQPSNRGAQDKPDFNLGISISSRNGDAQPGVNTGEEFEGLNLNPWRQELLPRPADPTRTGGSSNMTRTQTSSERVTQMPADAAENPLPPSLPLPQPFITREPNGSTATFFSGSSLVDCGVGEKMASALGSMGIQRPSHIQAAAIQALSDPELGHAAIADHAGSGKTLAYLIPIIQRLAALEQKIGGRVSKPGHPFAVIVLPTTELCAQVASVARAILQAGLQFTSVSMTGGYKKKTQRDRLREGVDIVIGTPGRLNLFLEDGELRLSSAQYVVLDEVDILLGDASLFAEQVQPLQAAASALTKFVLVTASLPEHTWMNLQLQFPGVKPILGPGLHRPAPGSLEQLIDCSGGDIINEETGFEQKFAGLLNALLNRPVPRTLIFCNKLITCRKVENGIKRARALQHMAVLPYHTGIDPVLRENNMAKFLSAGSGEEQPIVLISTDRASRGIDTSNVGHVVLFDFPRDPSEYVRRAGRTARGAGGQGVVTLLVLGRQVQLARQILAKTEKGLPLHGIPMPAI